MRPKQHKKAPLFGHTDGFLKVFKSFFTKLNLAWLSAGYFFHLWVRYLHDRTYESIPAYKHYTDKKYTDKVHRAVLIGFIASFILFSLLQSILPGLFSLKTPKVEAGANSITWTNNGDFYYNKASLCGATTRSNAIISGSTYSDATCATAATDSSVTLAANNDGDLNLSSGTLNINTASGVGRAYPDAPLFNVAAATASGQATVVVNSSTTNGLAPGDELLIINQGRRTVAAPSGLEGKYETRIISTITNGTPSGKTTITLTSNLTNAYDGTAYWITVQRVPVYNSITLSGTGTLTANGYSYVSTYYLGGIFFVKSVGAVSLANSVNMYAKGYAGGVGGATWGGRGGQTYNGEGGYGQDTSNATAATTYSGGGGGSRTAGAAGSAGGAGGGGVTGGTAYRGAGGGGGYATVGTGGSTNGVTGSGTSGGAGGTSSGTNAGGGGGGGTYGTAALDTLFMGSGGGSGGSYYAGSWQAAGSGGNGGGIVYIQSNNNITISGGGGINVAGGSGAIGTDLGVNGGGGGAGGSVILKGATVSVGSTVVTAAGGGGQNGGGNGGVGRIKIDANTINGTTTPAVGSTGSFSSFSVNYKSPATISGLKVDAGAGKKYKWSSLAWNTDALPSNTSVTFKYRTSDDGSTWSDASWANAGTTQSSGTTGTASLASLSVTRYLELQLILATSDGVSSPALNDFTVTYDGLEAPSNNKITMYRSDGSTLLKTSAGADVTAGNGAAWTSESSIIVKAIDLTCGTTGGSNRCGSVSNGRKPEIEIKPVGTSFATNPVSGTDTIVGTSYNPGADQELESGYVTISSSVLTTIGSPGYHFRVRTTDESGRVSAWTNYASDGLAFTIDQTTPTGTVTAPANSTSTSIALTNSASDGGGSGLAQMQFSNDGSSWSGWEAYNASKAWTVTSGDGSKTIYAQYKDWAGNVSGWVQTSDAEFNDGLTKTNLNISSGAITLYQNVPAVLVGTQAWATSNLNIGTMVASSTTSTNNGVVEKYCYGEDSANCTNYGGLYNWDELMSYGSAEGGQGICPTGFHVPSTSDYNTLFTYLGGASVAGTAMKSGGSSGLNYSLGGYLYYLGTPSWSGLAINGYYWTSTVSTNPTAVQLWSGNTSAGTNTSLSKSNYRFSVRCMKDDTNVTPYYSSGTFESQVYDSGTSSSYGAIGYASNAPSGTSLSVYVRGGSTAVPDGTWTSYTSSLGSGDSLASLNGKRYLQYKVVLTGGSATPSIYDINIQSAAVTTTTVDSSAPTGTVSINTGNPTYVSTKAVTLHLDPTDAAPSSGIKDFQLSNDGLTWGTATDSNGTVTDSGTWKAWSSTYTTGQAGYSWNLVKGATDGGTDGARTVYVKYRDNAGNVGGLTAPSGSWYSGVPGTAMEGKYVSTLFSAGTYAWGPTVFCPTSSDGSQPCQTGLDGTYPGYASFVSPQQYPSLDFTSYPAQNACKVVGGRLPYLPELSSMYSNGSSYGNNFLGQRYFMSATQTFSASTVYALYSLTGNPAVRSKLDKDYFQCVANPTLTISASVTLDTVTPATTLNVNPASPSGDNTWYKDTKPSLSLSASDTGSKVAKLSYKIDSDFAPYTEVVNTNTNQPFVVNFDDQDQPKLPEGQHTLYYFATDVAGQTEAHQSQSFKIDIQKPTTGYSINPSSPTGSNGWYITTAPMITLTPADENSGVSSTYYQFTNVGASTIAGFNADPTKGWAPYSIPFPAVQGDKTLHYYTRDNAGNVDDESAQTKHIKFNTYVPDKPSNFVVTASDMTTISLSWDAVTNDASGIASYTLEKRIPEDDHATWHTITAGNCKTLDGTRTSCTDSDGLTSGYYYDYRIKATDNGGQEGDYSDIIKAYTQDNLDPTRVAGVVATPCDGTTNTCAAIDSNGNPNTKGFSMKVTWTASSDLGVGMSKYLIYRYTSSSSTPSDWTVIGVVSAGIPQGTTYYDNDVANTTLSGSDKTQASDPLNDSTTYYYRITAYDLSGNHTDVVDIYPGDETGTGNQSAAKATPDVTAPTVPQDLVASAMGIDSQAAAILPDDPAPQTEPILHQRIRLSWSASIDYKHYHSNGEATGKEITYHIYQLKNAVYFEIGNTKSLTYNVDQLQDRTDYTFKISAVDADAPATENGSAQSSSATKKTASSQVPTVPTEVTVTSKKGNPNTDASVGHEVTITFKGSYAKNCDPNANEYCLTKYEVFRSTVNYQNDSDWVDPVTGNPVNATKIALLLPTRSGNDRDSSYSVTDTGQTYPATSGSGLSDATTYYYKIWAKDNTPAIPDGGPYYSPMTAVNVGTLHAGWDITPDATAPDLPAEVKVKDIHDDGLNYKRNIITWARITAPNRTFDGVTTNDFKEYRIYRSNDGLTWQQICKNGADSILLSACTSQYPNPLYDPSKELALANNYYMDLIPAQESISNQFFYYHVTAIDDSGDNFKYPAPNASTVINANYYNESDPTLNTEGNIDAVSLNPYIAKPTITTSNGGKKAILEEVGVSTAIVSWTTDQPADTIVEFRKSGTTDPYIGVVDRSMVVNHRITAKPLEPNTSYDYRVISRNSLANDAIAQGSDLPTLTTTGFNITPGTVSTTTSTAEINWTTNLDASSAFVEYQLQRQGGDEAQSGTAGVSAESLAATPRSHKVIVKGLRSNRTYTYKIKSISKDGFLSEYPSGSFSNFKTRNFDSAQFSLAPASSNVADKNITSTTAQIVWQTATETTSWVDYGTKSGVYGISSGNDNMTTMHIVTLEGLVPGTKYYYHVRVKDANEVEFTSQEYSFTAVIKPKISNLHVTNVTPYSATIAWDTNVETETVLNWGTTSAYGEKKGTAGKSQVHQVTVDNLLDNTEYHYQIVAHDEVGNEVVGADEIVRTPLDTEGPKITNVKTDIMPLGDSDSSAQVIVSWTTNKPATTKVEFDEGIIGGRYTKASTEDTSLNNSHTVIIKGLNVANTYHYRIVTKDKRGNTTISNDYTFVTPSKEQSIWQLIVKSLQDTFAWTKNIGSIFKRKG